MEEKTKIEVLLGKVLPKIAEQKRARKKQMAASQRFNLFFSMGIQTKEVPICRLLQDLLSPRGTHGLGAIFLTSFNKVVLGGLMADSELNHAVVYREERTEQDRRIDLTIETDKRYIPIEVKIFAGDRIGQCMDYYQEKENNRKVTGKPEPTVLYYLTPDGHPPSAESMGGLLVGTHIKTISFYKDMIAWIKDSLSESSVEKAPYVKYTLLQFMDVIERWRVLLENREIFDFINGLDPDEQECAVMIYKSIHAARSGREQDFLSLVDTEINKIKELKKMDHLSVEDKNEHDSRYRYSDQGSGIYIVLKPNAKKTKLTIYCIKNDKVDDTSQNEDELNFGTEDFSETIFNPSRLDDYVNECVEKIKGYLP